MQALKLSLNQTCLICIDTLITLFPLFPLRKNSDSKVRIIALVKINLYSRIKLRQDLMSNDFPSIWLELNNEKHKSLLIAGFYRQWSHENLSKAEAEQNGVVIIK